MCIFQWHVLMTSRCGSCTEALTPSCRSSIHFSRLCLARKFCPDRSAFFVKMVLEAIRYKPGSLQILNQLKLPHQTEYDEVKGSEDGWHAIKDMRTRGAPAIAIVAALSLAVELQNNATSENAEEVGAFIVEKLDYLVTSRPTAVNLADAARKLKKIVESAVQSKDSNGQAVVVAYCDAAAQMLISDVSDNQGIGKYGAEWIEKHGGGGQVSVLTHCNTG
jgi:methylthioribose-1-phosphate isomerase